MAKRLFSQMVRIAFLVGMVIFMNESSLQTGDKEAPAVVTLPAGAVGLDTLTVNGSIHPRGRLTTYYFEYGPTTAYGQKTPARPLPPRLAAFYHESWDDGFGGWASWFKKEHFKTGGANDKGFVRFAEPSNHDHNHDDGIGTVHLTKYLYPGTHPPSVFLGGGDPDFRDAKITISVRGQNWKPNGTELLWWTQSQTNEPTSRKDWIRPNWAYTGFLLTEYLDDGKWHKVEYRLNNNAADWSYTGGKGGYRYGSIDFCQEHLNIDCFHMVACVDTKNPPTGAIDFDELTIAYRNKSLLLPSNGGKIETAPDGDDPALLTDGWRNGKDKGWRSKASPAGPLEFVYRFAKPVKIEAVQLHQNPEWPAKDVDVFTSLDGKTYQPLLTRVLPDKHEHGPNWMFTVDRGLNVQANWFKVVLKSGYQTQHWGLGEIEVFGAGADMLPDDDLYYVNTDLTGLTKGQTCHYRLVAVQDGKTITGEDQVFKLPADTKPYCQTAAASRITATTAHLNGRLNPLGELAESYFEYGLDDKYGMKTPATSAGQQISARLVFATVSGLTPEKIYHYRLVGVNKSGTSHGEVMTFQTKTK